MLNKLQKIVVALWAAIAIPVVADVEDDLVGLYDEEELISIATGTQKQVRFAPSVASVITQKDIHRVGARTLDEALEMVPGLHVSRSFNRQDPIYSIRGIHTGQNPQVLLLVDGVRVQQLFTGARPFQFELPVNNIDRIEVIRGPGSALYGADAFAGVISVVTKTAMGIQTPEAGFRAGSFQRREAWVQLTENWGGVKFDFSLDYFSTDGDRKRTVNSDAQFADNPAISNAPGALETESEHWTTRARFSQNSWSLDLFSWHLVGAGLGTGGAQALDPVGQDEVDNYGFNLDIKPIKLSEYLTVANKVGVTVNELDAQFVLLPPTANFIGVSFPDGVIGNPSYKDTAYSVESTLSWSSSETHSLRSGVGLKYYDFEASETKNFDIDPDTLTVTNLGAIEDVTGTDRIYIEDNVREHYYFYMQDEWQIANDWQATLGIRYDKFTQFGDSINPRLALVWATTYNLTSKLLYGRAFRAPSFSELFARNNPSLRGNPNLEPEIIDTYEIAFDYKPMHDLGVRLNLYYFEIEDLVEIQFNTQAANAVEQSGYGFELEVDWNISEAFNLLGNYTWHDVEDDQSNQDVPNAASSQLYVSAEWQINDRRSLSLVSNYVADRARVAGDTRDKIDDYVAVDLVFRAKSKNVESIEIALIGKNIFDEDIREPSTSQFPANPEIPDDYPEEGRSLNFEILYKLVN